MNKTTMLLLLTVTGAVHGSTCSDESKTVRNVKLFNECHCASNEYPELSPALQKHGIERYSRNNATGWSEEIAGRAWYYCSISLRWKDKARRNDPTFCGDENRRRIVEEIKSALPHPVMINTPALTCN